MTLAELRELYPDMFMPEVPPESATQTPPKEDSDRHQASIDDVVDAIAGGTEARGAESTVDIKPSMPEASAPLQPPPPLPSTVYATSHERNVHVRDLVPQQHDVHTVQLEASLRPQLDVKRWKGHRWQVMGIDQRRRFDELRIEFEELVASWRATQAPIEVTDGRECVLCATVGDDSHSGRLLNYDAGKWVHVNCALWSKQVSTYCASAS